MKIDVCMVAGRRPDLIQTTLDSFNANLFRNFTVERFIVNIDPVFGSDDDQARCSSRRIFPSMASRSALGGMAAFCARIFRPGVIKPL